jgi:hypothetical protein
MEKLKNEHRKKSFEVMSEVQKDLEDIYSGIVNYQKIQ